MILAVVFFASIALGVVGVFVSPILFNLALLGAVVSLFLLVNDWLEHPERNDQ